MKRRFSQLICFITLSGTLFGGSYIAKAQDLDKNTQREMKREMKREHSIAKMNKWTKRHESKINKRLAKEQKFDTTSTARGSEVMFLDAQGHYVSLGYFDKSNQFRKYPQ